MIVVNNNGGNDLLRYPHKIGDHVEGPGFSGTVIALPGPYSVRLKTVSGELSVSNSVIEKNL